VATMSILDLLGSDDFGLVAPTTKHVKTDSDQDLSYSALLDFTEQLFSDEDTKDITVELADGTLRAHSLVLKQVSEVWARMLATDMTESSSRRIKIPDTTCNSMRVFLRLLYTTRVIKSDWQKDGDYNASAGKGKGKGKTPNTGIGPRAVTGGQATDILPLDLLLSVTTLAKRYMTRNVYAILVQAVKGRLEASVKRTDREEFKIIASHAIAADVGPLRMHALRIAETDAKVRKLFESEQLPSEVQFEFEGLWPPKKRRVSSSLVS